MMKHSGSRRFSAYTFFLIALIYLFASPAKAVVLTVTNLNDSGAGSLRQAILDANAAPGADTIQFESGAAVGTINLQSVLPDLSSQITINAPGANLMTVSRSASASFRIFKITSGQTVILNGLTIQGGVAPASGGKSSFAQGGGILNEGNLTVINCKLVGNTAITVTAYGGGIYNQGNLEVINSQLLNNNASTSAPGAPFAEARGSGIYNQGNATVSKSTINSSNGSFAIYNLGSISVSDSSITNSFGGIYSQNTVNLIRTTIAGNGQVGFVTFGGAAFIENSTISGNTFTGFSGGILKVSGGSVEIRNSTITDNQGNTTGGIYAPTGNCRIYNTIVAGNRTTGSAMTPDVSGNFVSGSSYNLIGNGSGGNLVNGQDGNIIGTSDAPVNAQLAQLGNVGGSTQTHRLLPTSPAINAGNPTEFPAKDQRGVPRPVGGSSDIGAYEFNLTPHRYLPRAGLNAFYNQTLSAFSEMPVPEFAYLLSAGSLPPGISFVQNTGNSVTLSGTLTAAGTYTFTVTAFNDFGYTVVSFYTLVVQNSVSFVGVRGRVLTADGKPIRRARVVAYDANGDVVREAFTNPFGYYRFNSVQAGENYVFRVFAKKRRFAQRNLILNEDLNDFNFIDEP